MSIKSDIKKDVSALKKLDLPWWALLSILVVTLIMGSLLNHWGILDLAVPLLVALLILGFIVRVKWEMRTRAWFWTAMTTIVATHAVLLIVVPWTDKWVPAVAVAAIASLDGFLMIAVFAVARRLWEHKSARTHHTGGPSR